MYRVFVPFAVLALSLAGSPPAAAADDGGDLVGTWAGVSAGAGFKELWTVKQDKGEWTVKIVYSKDGKEVGACHGERVKLDKGQLTFTQVFDKLPDPSWQSGAVVTLKAAKDKATFTWKVGDASGSGTLDRAKK